MQIISKFAIRFQYLKQIKKGLKKVLSEQNDHKAYSYSISRS